RWCGPIRSRARTAPFAAPGSWPRRRRSATGTPTSTPTPPTRGRTTAPRRPTGGRITHLIAGLGTTGTLMGTGRRLKEWNPRVELVAVQPDGPFHGLEGLKHLATAIVPPIYDPALADRTEFVRTEEAEDAVRALARRAGLLAGWSTGAALVAAQRVLAGLERRGAAADACVVAVAPDSGARYL